QPRRQSSDGAPARYVAADRPRRRVGCALRVSHLVRRVIDPAVPGGRRGADAHGACLGQPAARGRPHDPGRQFVPDRAVLGSARRRRVAAQTDGRLMLHFTKQELAARRRAACREMARQGLDGLLIFRQESMYYLTGYDTSGYSMFQGMYLGADGALALCTRSADLRQARITSVVEDVRIWRDRQGATPAEELRDMLDRHGCRGKRLGVEYHAYGLTAH